uniref:arginyltransferase n=1 Tax=Ningiella ruwaisensis TaxID=2364274 RepID=UPI00109F08C8|nr:arginyltransferase [Ningiella ruwaisensis]
MKFGITQQFPCNYLPDRNEQLLVCMAPVEQLPGAYSQLMHAGFRRSGDQLYRPHCPTCNQCNSVRIMVNSFSPSKSQKRVLQKNKDLRIHLTYEERDEHYPLYERYIEAMHSDGSMYPASYSQYANFIRCEWKKPLFMEARAKDKTLLAVAVTDEVEDGLSALYTYFAPEYASRSLGKYMIMQQIARTRDLLLPFLYLGYQIDDCRKMNYKTAFKPYQRLMNNTWTLFR